jgi:twitching motility protein PilT
VHITSGQVPWMRIEGELRPIDGEPSISNESAGEWLRGMLDEQRAHVLDEVGEVDLCHGIPEVGRFRANVFVQRKGTCGTFRALPNVIPTLKDLGVPEHLQEIFDLHQGMVVFSGPSGCGKSSTLAAFVNGINNSRPDHVLTLEDPVEFVHPPRMAMINQREIGRHSQSFARALRAALREDPEVIVVGEMRDPDTVRIALTASETGHLVFATLHTMSAIQAIDGLVDVFPREEQGAIRMSLSDSLKFVVCQTLLPRADGKGRVAAFEIIKGTPSVGHLIREGQTYQLPSLMQIGHKIGMRTLDRALEELHANGSITRETALSRAENKDAFRELTSDKEPDHGQPTA